MRKWSRKFDKCTQCGTTTKKHRGYGLCWGCYQKTPEKKEYNREYHKRPASKAKKQDIRLQNTYGISTEQKEQMIKQQNGVCPLCKKPFSRKKDIHIDHDHDSGEVRGILCSKCNLAIGLLYESIPTLINIINYLKKQ